jgi:predicted nucleic acid-binding protein
MSADDDFFDTNVLLYLMSGEPAKADRAEALIAGGGIVSVQVLNEFVSVASRKLRMDLVEIREILRTIRSCCRVEPLTISTHDLGLDLTQRFGLSIYDAMIVAAAILARCTTLYSEDLHHRQRMEGVIIRNPFVGDTS